MARGPVCGPVGRASDDSGRARRRGAASLRTCLTGSPMRRPKRPSLPQSPSDTRSNPMTRTLTLIAVLAALVVVGCGGDDTSDRPGNTSDRPGKAAVYERIDATTSCAELQREFDTAMDNVERYPGGAPKRDVPMTYADAAQSRIEALDC